MLKLETKSADSCNVVYLSYLFEALKGQIKGKIRLEITLRKYWYQEWESPPIHPIIGFLNQTLPS